MAGVMQAGIDLRPYFESTAPDTGVASDGADYASGLRDAVGSESCVRFIHSAAAVEPVLLARARLKLVLDPEGFVYVEAMGLAEDTVTAGKQRGQLPQATVRDLVRQAVAADSLQLEDAPREALASLRAQLVDALTMIDAAVEHVQDDTHSGN